MQNLSREIQVTDLTPEEMEEWLRNPTTRKVLQGLRSLRQEYQDQLVRGVTLNLTSVEQTALQTSRLLGQIYGLDLMLEMRPSDVEVKK